MALDNASQAIVDQMAASGVPPLHSLTPTEARSLTAAMAARYGPGPEMARVDDHVLPSSDEGTFGIRVFVPRQAPRAVVVYLHGGGWVLGSLDGFDTLARELADRTSATVVLVDYRTAPEHRFPTAVRDAHDALVWSAEHRVRLAGDDAPVVVVGDSAGGNLAAVLCLQARDAGEPAIAMQILLYPVTDCDFGRPSYLAPENQLLLGRDTMTWFWDHYLPDEGARVDPRASPLRAPDVSSLPPTLVLTAEHDVLRDEGEAYAARLEAAANTVTLHRMQGQMHGFFTMVNVLPGSADGLDIVGQAIDELLTSSPSPSAAGQS